MWSAISSFILAQRTPILLVLVALTAFMGYEATKAELSYDITGAVPQHDPEVQTLQRFKKKFGEESNIIALAFQDSSVFKVATFTRFRAFVDSLKKIDGVQEVLSLPNCKVLAKDTAATKFSVVNLFPSTIKSQATLDSCLRLFNQTGFYKNRLVNARGTVLLIITIKKEYAYSAKRVQLTSAVSAIGKQFENETHITMHYAGIPFIRSVVAQQIRNEMQWFLLASAIVTGIIMLWLFRSFRLVFFSMLTILGVVIWVLGSLALFHFKITLLSGLIPPVIVTIGITNAIYLVNKYHVEFSKHKDKVRAIADVMHKMGLATFLTNLTVAIGFFALLSTDIGILREFGLVAGINIFVLLLFSLTILPALFHWLPAPRKKELKHVEFKIIGRAVAWVNRCVMGYSRYVYAVVGALIIFSIVGLWQLKSITYIVDDLPESSRIKQDMKFIEANFGGTMPLEIWVDTQRKKGLLDIKNLNALDRAEQYLDSFPEISPPLSLLSVVKASKQAFYNGNPQRYELPSSSERGFILRYMKDQQQSNPIVKSFVDSTLQHARLSMQMADVGSVKLNALLQQIETRLAQIFSGTKLKATVTGSAKIFIQSNQYLVKSLKESLWWAFGLITLSMFILFHRPRMILISLAPNVLAMLITAGLMGYFGIPLKASTALIFSITFGISVDNSIRLLAKYRQEQLSHHFVQAEAIRETILESGKSIIYTSLVLFAGFILFAFSSFGGTVALGVLTSMTLLISMFTNLLLLPVLLLHFDKAKVKNEQEWTKDFDSEFYHDEEAK